MSTSMPIKIRGWKEEDLYNGFLETLTNLTEVGDIENKELFLATFGMMDANPAYHVIVAESNVGKKIVGVATLFIEQKLIHNCCKVGHIEDVAVRSGFQRRGIGIALIKALIFKSKTLNCKCVRRQIRRIILDCSEENIPFYEKAGFRKHESMMRLEF